MLIDNVCVFTTKNNNVGNKRSSSAKLCSSQKITGGHWDSTGMTYILENRP